MGQAGSVRLIELGAADFAALHHDAAGEFEDRVGLLRRSAGMPRVRNVFLRETDLPADEGVRAETVAGEVALGDVQGDLLTDLGVEVAAGRRAAEVKFPQVAQLQHIERVRFFHNSHNDYSLNYDLSSVFYEKSLRVRFGPAIQD